MERNIKLKRQEDINYHNMNELIRILAISPEDRTESDLDYLIEHEKELSTEQQLQLENETKDLDDDVIEEVVSPYVTKSLEKNVNKKIVRNFNADVKDLGDGYMRAIISSEAEDRHGEIIDMKGLDIKQYMKNPVISYLHDHTVPSIGRTNKLTKKSDGKLVAEFEWAIKNDLKYIHDKARLMYELYKEKFQFAFSIEFIPQEIDGNRYTKSEMVGFAPVVVPANPDALLLAKKKGLDKELLKTYNIRDMFKLEDIIGKELADLTLGEVMFLKGNKEKLTGEQLKKFASVLEDEDTSKKKEDLKDDKKDDKKEDKTLEAITSLGETVKTLADDVAEIKKSDPVVVKNINGQNDPDNKNININKNDKVSKEKKFLLFARALQSGNHQPYIDVVGKDAMNTTDDAILVPPFEFIQEIERLEAEVGVAARFANVRRMTGGAGFKYVQGDDDLEIFDTAESGVKKSTKLTYKQLLLGWRKFAGILPITDELTEDSAIDLWADGTRRFARAFAKRGDQLIFTEVAAGGNTKNGIINVAGTNTVTAGGTTFASVTADSFYDMVYGVPSASANGGRFYVNRSFLGVLAKLKDTEDRPIWQASIAEGVPATIAGKPYTEVDVLSGVADEDADLAVAVFGDLKYATLAERTGLNVKIFDSGLVGDPDDEDQSDQINLLTQDVQAMRAVRRMNAVVRFPEAFSVLKLSTNS